MKGRCSVECPPGTRIEPERILQVVVLVQWPDSADASEVGYGPAELVRYSGIDEEKEGYTSPRIEVRDTEGSLHVIFGEDDHREVVVIMAPPGEEVVTCPHCGQSFVRE